jgi:hypothetical protein
MSEGKANGPKVIAHRFEGHKAAFLAVEPELSGSRKVPFIELKRRLADSGIRQAQLLTRFLTEKRLLTKCSSAEQHIAQYRVATEQMLKDARQEKWSDVIDRYYQHLRAIQEKNLKKGFRTDKMRPTEKSITTYVGAATKLMTFVFENGCVALEGLTQQEVDAFLFHRPGYRNSLISFLKYLNKHEKVFAKLKLKWTKGTGFAKYYIGARRTKELIKEWHTANGKDTRNATVFVLALLYAQPFRRTTQLRLIDLIKGDAETYQVAFDGYELQVDSKTTDLISRYLKWRESDSRLRDKAWANEFLFPSDRKVGHLEPLTFAHALRRYGLTQQNLYTTALCNAYLNGLRLPKVAVKGFGITLPTAMQYSMMANERVRAELLKQLDQDQ